MIQTFADIPSVGLRLFFGLISCLQETCMLVVVIFWMSVLISVTLIISRFLLSGWVRKVFTVTEGFKRGYGATSPDEIQVKGEPLADMRITDFKAPRSTVMGGTRNGFERFGPLRQENASL